MPGYAPKLPLRRSLTLGFELTKTIKETLAQNLKNLVLTSPGERMMIPNFGVGVRDLLFEQDVELARDNFESRLLEQVSIFMPGIQIVSVFLSEGTETTKEQFQEHLIQIRIDYIIQPLNVADVLELTVNV